MAGWWFGTMEFAMTFPSYWEWNVIIPTDFQSIICQRGRLKPPTRYWRVISYICIHHPTRRWYPQNSWFRRHGWCQALSMALWRVHDRSKTVSFYAVPTLGLLKNREPQHSVSFWKSCYPCVTGIVLVQLVYCIVMYTLFRGKPEASDRDPLWYPPNSTAVNGVYYSGVDITVILWSMIESSSYRYL